MPSTRAPRLMYALTLSDHWRGPAASAMMSRASLMTLFTGGTFFSGVKENFDIWKAPWLKVQAMCFTTHHASRPLPRQELGGRVRNSGDGWLPIGAVVAAILERSARRCDARCSGRASGPVGIPAMGETMTQGASVSPDARGHGGHDEQAGIR